MRWGLLLCGPPTSKDPIVAGDPASAPPARQGEEAAKRATRGLQRQAPGRHPTTDEATHSDQARG